jgi:hypothetical protein
MLEAFEHVHVEEYIGLVRATRSKAKPKLFHILLDLSVQAVRRKNGSFLRRNHPTHLHYFTKGTVLQTMTLSDTKSSIISVLHDASSWGTGSSTRSQAFRDNSAFLADLA